MAAREWWSLSVARRANGLISWQAGNFPLFMCLLSFPSHPLLYACTLHCQQAREWDEKCEIEQPTKQGADIPTVHWGGKCSLPSCGIQSGRWLRAAMTLHWWFVYFLYYTNVLIWLLSGSFNVVGHWGRETVKGQPWKLG